MKPTNLGSREVGSVSRLSVRDGSSDVLLEIGGHSSGESRENGVGLSESELGVGEVLGEGSKNDLSGIEKVEVSFESKRRKGKRENSLQRNRSRNRRGWR